MERKNHLSPLPEKLIAAAAIDYPAAAEIVVSFPDAWQFVSVIRDNETPLYVAGLPRSIERSPSDHFYGLSPEINRSLTTYRLYKLFEPQTRHLVQIAWDTNLGQGRVIGGAGSKVYLQPLGQAQTWQGETCSLIWECFLFDGFRQRSNWIETLAAFWQTIEADLTAKILTQPREPTFEEGYPEFLSRLGYNPDPPFEGWWSKEPGQ